MSKYVKNYIILNQTTSTYLPVATEKNKKLARLDTKGLCAEEWRGSPQVPMLGNSCFLSWHAGKAGNVGSYCWTPCKKAWQLPPSLCGYWAIPMPWWAPAMGKGVTPSLIHFQHEPTLHFSVSLNKWIVFAGNTHLKCSGKRLILGRTSSVATCVLYSWPVLCFSIRED